MENSQPLVQPNTSSTQLSQPPVNPPLASPQPTPVMQPPAPKKSSLKTILFIVCGGILLFVGGVGYYTWKLMKVIDVPGQFEKAKESQERMQQIQQTQSPSVNQTPDSNSTLPVATVAPSVGLQTYVNETYDYTINYPSTWKITTEDYNIPATSTSKLVNIFNPQDDPAQSKFSCMTIEYVGMLQQDVSQNEAVLINGVTMRKADSPEGPVYYVNVPDTDVYLVITGAGGNTSNEATNQGLRAVLASFQWVTSK